MNSAINHPVSYQSINESLAQVCDYINKEAQLKIDIVRRQQEVIDSLVRQRDEYKQLWDDSRNELQQVVQLSEGKKQLVDKLLGDIARLQQDIEWYKKTYEERSFWGTILEKIKRKL
jgi:septation ring formation regulator EzrA